MIANSIFAGDYLTTEGQPVSADLRMIADLGFEVEGTKEATLPRDRADVSLRRRGAGTKTPANS
jgi:biotin synthase